MLRACFRYTVFQLERAPETGKLHFQGFLQLKQPRCMNGVKAIIGGNPHLEICKNHDKAVEYAQKEETRVAGPWSEGVLSFFIN